MRQGSFRNQARRPTTREKPRTNPCGAFRYRLLLGARASALAARELLAQGRERLVRGERAGRRSGRGALLSLGLAAVGRRSALAGLGLGLAGLLDLLAVGLEALLGLGVLPLPLLTLLVE